MRFYTVLSSRPAYYDRSPTQQAVAYGNSGVAPHSATVRWTYTVPANRKAIVATAYAFILRDGAAGAAGEARLQLAVTPSGGSITTLVDLGFINVAVDTYREAVFTGPQLLVAGDTYTATSADASTGGTTSFTMSAIATEFTA